MPNQLPQSNLADRLGLRIEQRPIPPVVTVNGKVVPIVFAKKINWNRIMVYAWFLLFVVAPLTLGIIEMVK